MREGTERRRRVIVVEDDSDIASLLSEILESEGYSPVAVTDGDDLKAHLHPRPDLIVLDLRLSRDSAEQILETVRARGMDDVPVLLLSAASDLAERAKELGVRAYLAKPFQLDELLVAVRHLA